jgi:hypothetical protein
MEKEYIVDKSGYPTNLSVRNCKIPSAYQCYDTLLFRSDIEPQEKTGYDYLNPAAIQEKYSKDFVKIECRDPQSCPKIQYASTDPRLISVAHGGQVLTLDRPSVDSSVKLADLAVDTRLDGYGQGYRTYSDINAGYISYYVDKSIEDPYFNPNFVTSATTTGKLYQDPMGSMKPYYNRYPLKCNDPLDTDHSTYDGCLSWIQDSTGFREDIMAHQMSRQNRERWEPRWS